MMRSMIIVLTIFFAAPISIFSQYREMTIDGTKNTISQRDYFNSFSGSPAETSGISIRGPGFDAYLMADSTAALLAGPLAN